MKIEELEDYPALVRLSRTLWKSEGARGAALMVGAGISRSAILAADDVPLPPLWSHLQAAMASELYPADPNRAPNDALRLAEEYRVYFGQNALDDFIRGQIKDTSWAPAALHQTLLELPWSDILTTNYDTILERASESVNRAYEPVTCPADLARTRAPRIVKLHGSINQSGPFILAAEDYRTYPQTHGAFVNFARQTFIENDLCLLGFSGDDPNFLAWAGWVRDHLGELARRIYLVGALNLGAAKRRYLEAHKIVPIDFYGAVNDLDESQQHEAATHLFLDYLRDHRPKPSHDWQPSECPVAPSLAPTTAEEKIDQLRACVTQWAKERESYPGWLICPGGKRAGIRHETAKAPMSLELLEALSISEALSFFVELIWRHRTALWPLDPLIVSWIYKVADLESTTLASQQQRAVLALALLRHARLQGDIETFKRWSAFLKGCEPSLADLRAEIAYETALLHCERFDLAAASLIADDIEGKDPVWALRKAAILAECGKLETAEALIRETLKDLQRRERLARSSIWIQSRLAYFDFIAGGYRRDRFEEFKWDDRYREMGCDPWREIDSLNSTIISNLRKSVRRLDVGAPRFDPGSSVPPTFSFGFGGFASVKPIDELTGLLEAGGIPAGLRHLTIFKDERIDALTLEDERDGAWYLKLIRYLADGSDELLDRYLSRVTIATLPSSDIDRIAHALLLARNYWLKQLQGASMALERDVAFDRFKSVLHVLARFVIRLPSGAALDLHLETLGQIVGGILRSPLLFKTLSLILTNSYQAIAPESRHLAAERALSLPLPSDPHAIDPLRWINKEDLRQIKPSSITCLVDEWIAKLETKDLRDPAIHRLYYMIDARLLSASQTTLLSERLWSQVDLGTPPLPQQTVLYPFSLVDIPKPDGTSAKDDIKKRTFSTPPDLTTDQQALSIVYAIRSKAFEPTPKQARELFDAFSAWRSPVLDPARRSPFPFYEQNQRQIRHALGVALSESLAPFLASADKTAARAKAVLDFIGVSPDNAGLSALLPFLSKFPDRRHDLSRQILKGFMSSNSNTIRCSYDAVQRWIRSAKAVKTFLPYSIIDRLITMVEIQAIPELPMLLDTVRIAVERKVLKVEQIERLGNGLQDLLEVAQYKSVSPQSKLAVDISLIRCAAVRLAATLKAQRSVAPAVDDWLTAGREDVLPEVRYWDHGRGH
nr:SIR2 family protein [Acetobacter syzygii]